MKTKLQPINARLVGICLAPGRALFIFTFLFFLGFIGSITAQTKVWDKTLGGDRNDDLSQVVATPDGGYLLGGTSISGKTGDKTDFNRNGLSQNEEIRRDYWVVKINNKGQKVWDKTFGGTNSDVLEKVIATPDGGFLLGGTSSSGKGGDKSEASRGESDYWLVKIDNNGNKQWDKTLGGNKLDEFRSMLPALNNTYILAGVSTSDKSGDKSNGILGDPVEYPYDFWIIKISANGTKIWDKTLGNGNSENLEDMIQTTDNNYVLGGTIDGYYSIMKISQSGNKIWQKSYANFDPEFEVGRESCQSITATPDGGILLGGYSESGIGETKTDSSRGETDYWLLKLNSSGNKVWDEAYGGSNQDFLMDVTPTKDGGFLLGGYSNSDVSSEKSVPRLGPLDPDNYYSGFDYWVIKVNAVGKKLWDKVYGGADNDILTAVTKSQEGYVLAGSSNSSKGAIKSENSRGGNDFWVINIKELNKIGQQITLNPIPTKKPGDAPFTVIANSTSSLPVTVSVISGPAVIKNKLITLTGTGVVTLKASQPGNATYLPAPDVTYKFLISSFAKQWDKTLGSGKNDEFTAMITTSDDGYLLGGYSWSGIGGDKSQNSINNSNDYWVVKTDANGTKLWDKRFGGTDGDYLMDIVAAPDGGYVLGGYSSSGIGGHKTGANRGPANTYDYWVVKITATGLKVWDKTFGGKGNESAGSGDRLEKIVVTPDGGYLLAGTSDSGIGAEKSQIKGGEDFWAIKINGQGDKIWDKSFGGTSLQNGDDKLQGLINTSDGNFLLAGFSNSDVSGNKSEPSRGTYDYWMLKIDPQGNKLWDKTLGGNGHDALSAVIATSDGGYLLGGSSSSNKGGDKSEEVVKDSYQDFWIVKTDANGKKLWDKTYGNQGHDDFRDLVPTADGGYILGGNIDDDYYNEKVEPSRGLEDFWLIKVNSNGSKTDEKIYGGNQEDKLIAILPLQEGKYLLGGSSTSGIGGDKTEPRRDDGTSFLYNDYWLLQIQDKVAPGQVTWDAGYGGTDRERLTTVLSSKDGGYLLGGFSLSGKNGTKTQTSYGANDFWLVKTKANGQKVWDKRYGGTENDYLNALLPTPDGGYLLGGSSDSGQEGDKSQTSRGGRDYWVVKVNSQGMKQWDKRYGSTGFEDIRALASLPNGDYLLGGYSDSPAGGDKSQGSQGQKDFWVVRIKPNGQKVWDKRYGGTADEELEALVVTAGGKILLGGSSNSGVSGNVGQQTRGSWDYWLMEIDQAGTPVWEKRYGGTGQDKLTALLASSDNNYVLAGTSGSGKNGDKSQASQGQQDYWLVKVNSAGAKLWDQRFGGSESELLWALKETPDKGYVLGGSSASGISGDKSQASQGKTDFWLVKTNAAGTRQWDQRYGGNQEDELRAIWPLAKGGYVLAGRSNSGKSGDKTTANLGNTDFWLLQVAPDLGPDAIIAARTRTAAEKVAGFRTYPNPFREKVRVRYAAAQTQLINVLVYDSQGRVVARLYQGQVEAGQQKEWEWQPAANHPSGLYILRVQAPDQVLTSKLLLIR